MVASVFSRRRGEIETQDTRKHMFKQRTELIVTGTGRRRKQEHPLLFYFSGAECIKQPSEAAARVAWLVAAQASLVESKPALCTASSLCHVCPVFPHLSLLPFSPSPFYPFSPFLFFLIFPCFPFSPGFLFLFFPFYSLFQNCFFMSTRVYDWSFQANETEPRRGSRKSTVSEHRQCLC